MAMQDVQETYWGNDYEGLRCRQLERVADIFERRLERNEHRIRRISDYSFEYSSEKTLARPMQSLRVQVGGVPCWAGADWL